MPQELTAIVASHYQSYSDYIRETLEENGYSVVTVSNPNDLKEELNKNKYSLYVIEVNLGYSGVANIRPLQMAWEKIHDRVECSESRLIAFSSYEPAIQAANAFLKKEITYKAPDFLATLPDLIK